MRQKYDFVTATKSVISIFQNHFYANPLSILRLLWYENKKKEEKKGIDVDSLL